MTDELVLYAVHNHVATLTLNRPEKRNALSPDLVEALLAQLQRAREDRDVRVVVLTGAGDKAFCAGGDLGAQQGGDGLLALHNARERFHLLLTTLMHLGKPTLARVQAHALGGGLGLMLACNLAVASRDAEFGTPEVKVGLFPMMIMALIFRNIGHKKTMELMLTGDRFSAADAERMGLLNYAVPPEDLDERVHLLASRIAAHSPAVLQLGLDAAHHTLDMPLDDALQHLRAHLTLNTLLDDAGVGIAAFLTKQRPDWKGR